MNLKKIAPLALGLLAGMAQAGLVIKVQEVGGNVVFAYSGSVNLASTLFKEADRDGYNMHDVSTTSFLRSVSANVDDYNLNLTASPAFGSSGYFGGGVSTGDSLLLESVGFNQIWLPDNYASGNLINGSMTFAGASFASMGLLTGSYDWTWNNGAVSDFARFVVGPDSGTVPEPMSLALVGLALGAASLTRRNRRAK